MDTPQWTGKSSESGNSSLFRSAPQDKSGKKGVLVVLIVGAIVSLICWYPLSLPSRLIRALLPNLNCTNIRVGSMEMYLCSFAVGVITMIGPVLLMVLVFFFRKQLTKWIGRITPKLPVETRFLTAPTLATVIFTVGWSGAHQATALNWGILPHMIFPAVIGLFTYAVSFYGTGVQSSLIAYFNVRDKFPKILRYLLVIGIPMLIAIAITAQERVSLEALKEQFIVIVALVTGYLLMAPRSGEFFKSVIEGMKQKDQK